MIVFCTYDTEIEHHHTTSPPYTGCQSCKHTQQPLRHGCYHLLTQCWAFPQAVPKL